MMSCDTNVLFAALDSDSVHHASAVAFLNDVRDSEQFGLCELMLVELYGLLRNPMVVRRPQNGAEVARIIHRFRSHPRWLVLDYPGAQSDVMNRLWGLASDAGFPYRRIYDARLALTLRHHGVTEFATRNVKDFQGFGFKRVWNPLAESTPK
jgi:toxin-antitoxin system PIN domain toxin